MQTVNTSINKSSNQTIINQDTYRPTNPPFMKDLIDIKKTLHQPINQAHMKYTRTTYEDCMDYGSIQLKN